MKLNEKQNNSLFKIFIISVFQFLFINLYVIISAISGVFDWTIERLTSSLAGVFIQILDLVLLVNGIILFLYIVAFILILIKG